MIKSQIVTGLAGSLLLAQTWYASAAVPPPGRYVVKSSARATITLPSAPQPGPCYVRGSAGTWRELTDITREQGSVTFSLRPDRLAPDGEALVIIDKPSWMVLDDSEPPRLVAARSAGKAYELSDGRLDLGCLDSPTLDLTVDLADAANPISAAGTRFRLLSAPTPAADVRVQAAEPPGKTGRVTIVLQDLAAGAYTGEIVCADMAPSANALAVRVGFSVMGVSVSSDQQSVSLAGAQSAYRFQPHLSQQLLLPGEVWSKLTTRMDGTWLYPRQVTNTQMLADDGERRTVLITTSVQDIKGKPHEGLGELEYELTVRADTPALFVTSRSRNISAKDVPNEANWGWLPAPYFATAEGRKEWRGKAQNAYLDVGKVGWVWLAPNRPGQPGLVWMSSLKFGESRFDTMLLYAAPTTSEPGAAVEATFAIAPARDEAAAAAIYSDLKARSLLP